MNKEKYCNMTPEQLKNSELDRLINNALRSDDKMIIPQGIAEKAIRRHKKKVLLWELVSELSWKVGLVTGSLVLLAGVFVWINGKGILDNLYSHFVNNRHVIVSLLILVFVTILIDQIALKFYNAIKKEASLNSQ